MTARIVERKDGSALIMVGNAVLAEKPKYRKPSRVDQKYSIELHRLREIEKVVKHRHGRIIPDGSGTDDEPLCVAYIKCAAFALSGQDITAWCTRFAPWADAELIGSIEAEASKRKRMISADGAAGLLHVTIAERTELDLRTIGACDMTESERKAFARSRKRDRDRVEKARKRRADGCQLRASYEANSISKAKPWETECISRATWYRRNETSAALIDINTMDDGPVSRTETDIPPAPPSTHLHEETASRGAAGFGNQFSDRELKRQSHTGNEINMRQAEFEFERPV